MIPANFNKVYGGGDALHDDLLTICEYAEETVEVAGQEYTIPHTIYADYDLEEVLRIIHSETEAHPYEDGLDFEQEVEEAIEGTKFHVPLEDKSLFRRISYFNTRNIGRAATDMSCFGVREETEEQPWFSEAVSDDDSRMDAVVNTVTLQLAQEAALRCQTRTTGITSDGDEELYVALLHAIRSRDEQSIFSTPDPSKSCIREIDAMLEPFHDFTSDDPLCPDPYFCYGLYVTPDRLSTHDPKDARQKELFSGLGNVMTGRNRPEQRWTSENEPPLTTLDSYEERE